MKNRAGEHIISTETEAGALPDPYQQPQGQQPPYPEQPPGPSQQPQYPAYPAPGQPAYPPQGSYQQPARNAWVPPGQYPPAPQDVYPQAPQAAYPQAPQGAYPQAPHGAFPHQPAPGHPQYPAAPPYGQYPVPPQYGQYPYQQPAAAWMPRPQRPKPASWGLRIAAGIIALLIGLWTAVAAVGVFTNPAPDWLHALAGFLIIAGGIGSLVAGILVLVSTRSASPGASVTLLASAAAVLAGHSLAGRYALPPGHLLALAAIIVAGLALAKDRAAAGAAVPAHPRLRRVAAIAAVVASIFTFSNFAFSVRLWDGFDVSLPFNMVAGPALLAGGILLLARRGGDGELFVVLGAGAMGLVGAAATWIMFPPSGAAVLAPCLAVTVLAAVVFIREKGLNPSGWIARPFDA